MHCISLIYRTIGQIQTLVKSVRSVTPKIEMLCMGTVWMGALKFGGIRNRMFMGLAC